MSKLEKLIFKDLTKNNFTLKKTQNSLYLIQVNPIMHPHLAQYVSTEKNII